MSCRSFDLIEEKPTSYLIPLFLEEGQPNIFFGKGGSGKSYLSLKMAMCLADGSDFLDKTPSRTVNTLFMDYEGQDSVMKRRMRQISNDCPKWNPEHEKRLFYYDFPSGKLPFNRLVNELSKTVKDNDIELLVIDSAALACGGEPEKAETAINFFNALSMVPVTSLIIAHETKAGNNLYPFGSIFFHNCGRNIFNVQSDNEKDGTLKASLYHRKSNSGKLSMPLGAKITFTKKGVSIASCSVEDNLKCRVLNVLKESPMKLSDIIIALKCDLLTLKPILSRLKSENMVKNVSHGEWAINDSEFNF